jgi:hypothetical protein
VSDYTQSRWAEIKAMTPRPGGLRSFIHQLRGNRPRARMIPMERRRLGPYLHQKNIDRDAGGTGYSAAPAGFRWRKERLVPRHSITV